jgi:hypothetical protein
LSFAGTVFAQTTAPAPPAGDAPIILQVDATTPTHRISPLVYGRNNNGPHIPFVRQGGNRYTAWNWENNASNAGGDWHHQNDGALGGGDVPGEVARAFLDPLMQRGATALLTVPMAGYVAADKKADGDVNQTPDYLQTRFVKSFAKKKAAFADPPDLNDKAVYQDEFVWWVNRKFPAGSRHGGNIFYSLDNEPECWSSTHERIHPQKPTYAEMVTRTTELASAIKDVQPDATILGFVSFGYLGYVSLGGAPDADGRDFINYFLDAMRSAEKVQGRRLVDVLDLHWYPEAHGGGKRIVFDDTKDDPAAAKARVQAPRSLWDPTYQEDSWIAKDSLKGPIHLLPRLKQQIVSRYPGTKLAFTEYDYGGDNHISGALAEADVLGVFGEQDVYAAALFSGGKFQAEAFNLYVNYDGKGSAFADQSLRASSSNVAEVSVHAARTQDGHLTLVVINRSERS